MATRTSPFRPLSSYLYFSLFMLLFVFSNCKKEKISIEWEELNSGTDINLTAVHFTDELTGHIVGGVTWFSGSYLQTNDGGDTWTVEEISNKQFFDIEFNANGIGHAVGIDGYLFSATESPYDEWTFHRMPRWDILRGVCFNSRNEGVLVGGIAFAEGAIMVVAPDYTVPVKDTFPNQLEAVCYSDDNTIHAVGYGLVLRSTDAGQTWVETETSDDFFQAITFPSSSIGYIVGYNGTILKTTDSGSSWKQLRNGDAIAVSDQPFTGMHFADTDNGYIVGEKGICWRTYDGGENWETLDLPDIDFNDVFIIEDKVYLVGKKGRIIRFNN